MKTANPAKNCAKNFKHMKKFYVHKIAPVNLSKFTSWKTRKQVNQTTAF